MSDIDSYVEMGHSFNQLRQTIIRSAIEALHFPLGSRGLDAGCGPGLQVMLLAEAVGPGGHITGLDLSPELLVHAEEIVKTAGLAERVSFREVKTTLSLKRTLPTAIPGETPVPLSRIYSILFYSCS